MPRHPEPLVQGTLGPPNGGLGACGQLAGYFCSFGYQIFLGHRHANQTDALRLPAIQEVAGKKISISPSPCRTGGAR